jgi:hypothetical protein
VVVARRIVTRWRAFVAKRKGVLLRRLLVLPDLFQQEVLKRLDPFDRTMVAQVGRPWLAAVLASGLPRSPKGVPVRLRLREFCTSIERLAWARANGCPWGEPDRKVLYLDRRVLASWGYLDPLQYAREHGYRWGAFTCYWAAAGGHLVGRSRFKG